MPETVLIDGTESWRLPEYRVCAGMKYRCFNIHGKDWKNYGGRGIRVCEEWSRCGGFERFIEHIGRRPSPKHQIDRINNDGNYEPGNVRWVTQSVQNYNKRILRSGFEHGRTALNRLQVRVVQHCTKLDITQRELAVIFNTSHATILRATRK